MKNIISKSVICIFIFDLVIFILSTAFISKFLNMSFILSIVSICIITATGLYSLYLKGNYIIREFNVSIWNAYRLFEGVIFAHIPCAIALFIYLPKPVLWKFLFINIVVIYAFLYLYRFCFHYYLFNLKKIKNILIVGADNRAKIILDIVKSKPALKMKVIGFAENTENTEEDIDNIKIMPVKDGIYDYIVKNDVNIVIFTNLSPLLLDIPYGVQIYNMPDFYEKVTGKYYIDENSMEDFYYDFLKKKSHIYDFCKRVFDIIAAGIILTVTLPILVYIAIRIKLTDNESPIYTQNRVGRGGKIFKCYKLRTMYANNYIPKNLENGGYAKNQDQDSRVIPWCKFVRKARFDEIPQMINIIKGEMSIVGPRAEWEEVVKIYSEKIKFYNCRMWVKTGWTGWAQINQGHLFSIDDEEGKLVYDLYYIKNRNILWEISILIKAIFMALGGRHE